MRSSVVITAVLDGFFVGGTQSNGSSCIQPFFGEIRLCCSNEFFWRAKILISNLFMQNVVNGCPEGSAENWLPAAVVFLFWRPQTFVKPIAYGGADHGREMVESTLALHSFTLY